MRYKWLFIAGCFMPWLLCSCSETNREKKEQSSEHDSSDQSLSQTFTETDTTAQAQHVTGEANKAASTELINSVAQANNRLTKRASAFVIKTNRDTVIKCRQGTILAIPANAFLNAKDQGTVNEVRISVREFYSLSDCIVAGLSTTSNDRLLETGGMLNIQILSAKTNDTCIIKPGKNISIAMPGADTSRAEGMRLFNGRHDGKMVNWAPASGVWAFVRSWRPDDLNLQRNFDLMSNDFVFPDEPLKNIPAVINTNPANLKAEVRLPIRDLLLNAGPVTKKANAYIDTLGNLHCYRMGNNRQDIVFNEIYSPAIYQKLKVNVAVNVSLSYTTNLNQSYYLKLFKFGKGKPDSLIAVEVTLKPAAKPTGHEDVKAIHSELLTVSEFRKKQGRRARQLREYESMVKKLKLDEEVRMAKFEKDKAAKMADLEINGASSLQNAQEFFLLNTSQLGWINCDRFYNVPEKVNYTVKLTEKTCLLMVFNAFKSIMAPDEKGVFRGVPLNEPVTLIALKTEAGKLMMACQQTTITNSAFGNLHFEPVTLQQYKSRLEKLNNM